MSHKGIRARSGVEAISLDDIALCDAFSDPSDDTISCLEDLLDNNSVVDLDEFEAEKAQYQQDREVELYEAPGMYLSSTNIDARFDTDFDSDSDQDSLAARAH